MRLVPRRGARRRKSRRPGAVVEVVDVCVRGGAPSGGEAPARGTPEASVSCRPDSMTVRAAHNCGHELASESSRSC